jgi:hypothetical protein
MASPLFPKPCGVYHRQDGDKDPAMSDETETPDISTLPPAAQRALQEAEARRNAEKRVDLARELGGRDGPEPVRYGDWEKKGIAIDF